jgi:hypothetical protein
MEAIMLKEEQGTKNDGLRNAQSHGALRECAERAAELPALGNTGSSNYSITPYVIKVDSLYLTYKGALKDDVFEALQQRKEWAQKAETAGLAQYIIGDHFFEVRAHGARNYPFILVDNAFRIQLSLGVGDVPFAVVQIMSEYLACVGTKAAVAEARALLNQVDQFVIAEPALVSRVDLSLDFKTKFRIGKISSKHLVCRARKLAKYYDDGVCTGFTIGTNNVMCRVYNKSIQMKGLDNSPNNLLEQLRAAGWNGIDDLWRVEFQMRRNAIKQLQISTFTELEANYAGLWRYLTESWLRVVHIDKNQQNKTRWSTEDFWLGVQEAYGIAPKLERLKKEFNYARPVNESRMFRDIRGPLQFMANQGIHDFELGMKTFLEHGVYFFYKKSGDYDSYQTYLEATLRRYRVRLNQPISDEPFYVNDNARRRAEQMYKEVYADDASDCPF